MIFALGWTYMRSASARCAARATAFSEGVLGSYGGMLGFGEKEKMTRNWGRFLATS